MFTTAPITELYALLPADVWSQITVHRVPLSAMSADLLSATLSSGMVHLNQVMSIHHQCEEGGSSLQSMMSRLPVSPACLVSESREGEFTVLKAWPDLDLGRTHYTLARENSDENCVLRFLKHHDELQVLQAAWLLQQAELLNDEEQIKMLQEVCHLLSESEEWEPPDDDGPSESVSAITRKRGMQDSHSSRGGRSTAAAAPASRGGGKSGKRLPLMPEEVAQKLHARFGHPGRKRLIGALRIFGWLRKFTVTVPLDIKCAACAATKARRRPHLGRLIKATYPGQVIHVDLFTAGITGIEGSNYSAIFTDEKSRKKLAINLKLKSDFAGIMTEFLARLSTLPEMMVLDSGGENISKQFLEVCYRYCIRPRYTVAEEHEGNLSERSIQSLRDTAMTMLASAALSPVFWPFALMYAAVIDQFVPGPEGKAPYMHWHDQLPPNLNLPIFGSKLVYRQEMVGKQRQLDLPGDFARFLGCDPVTNWVWIINSSEPGNPVRRTSEVLQRTFCESEVLDISGPQFSKQDYSAFGKPDTSDLSEPVDIQNYLASDLKLSDSPDLGMFAEARQFVRRRRRFLHRRGDLSASEIEALIAREWRRRAHQRMNTKYDPMDDGTYLDALLADYDSDTEEPDSEIVLPEVEQPTVQSPRTTSTRSQSSRAGKQVAHQLPGTSMVQDQLPRLKSLEKRLPEPVVPPKGTDLAEGLFINTKCEICDGKHFNKKDKQMMLCDMCDRGFHRCCLKQTWISPDGDGWCCSKCLGDKPNTVIEILKKPSANPKKARRNEFVSATVVHINQTSKFGRVQVAYEGELGTREVDLRKIRWRLPGYMTAEAVYYVNELNELVALKEPRSWKAIQKIDDLAIRAKWNQACKDEVDGLKKANLYKLVDRPSGVKCIPMVWVFKIKQPKVGEEIGRFKARCCLLGNLMDPSDQNFSSPTPRLSSFRYALSWAAKTGAAVWSADVEQAFLLAAPAEPIYATFPPGFEDPNGKVMFLLKNLYGSTTAPFQFNNYLSNSLILQGFKPNPFDPCLFSKMVEGSLMIVLVFVDDSIAIHQNPKVLEEFYNECGTALGGAFIFGQLERNLTRFLGFDIIRDKQGFILSQVPLIEKIFKVAKDWMPQGSWDQVTTTPIAKDSILEGASPRDPNSLSASDRTWLRRFPYREILGAIGYVALGTRPDVSYSYKSHGRWASCFDRPQCMSLLSLVRYLHQTKDKPLVLCSTPGHLCGKSDADWNGTGQSLSTTGWIVFDGAAPISWTARTNKASAKSTAEAEFMSTSSLAVELVYLKRLVESLHVGTLAPIALYPRIMDERDAAQLGRRPTSS